MTPGRAPAKISAVVQEKASSFCIDWLIDWLIEASIHRIELSRWLTNDVIFVNAIRIYRRPKFKILYVKQKVCGMRPMFVYFKFKKSLFFSLWINENASFIRMCGAKCAEDLVQWSGRLTLVCSRGKSCCGRSIGWTRCSATHLHTIISCWRLIQSTDSTSRVASSSVETWKCRTSAATLTGL